MRAMTALRAPCKDGPCRLQHLQLKNKGSAKDVCGLFRWLSGKKKKISLPMQEIQVQSLGGEDPLEEEMATHSSILAWRIPWTEEAGRLQSVGSQKDMTERLNKDVCVFAGRGGQEPPGHPKFHCCRIGSHTRPRADKELPVLQLS